MSTRNELEPFCLRFDLTNLTDLKEICPMSIIGKPIKRRIEKLHDLRWRNVSSENKAIVTDSSPPDDFFPHKFISQAIDDEMKGNVDLLSRASCEKYLRPFLYVMDEQDPRGLLDIAMASKYWSAFFVKTFTAWAGTQGNTKHHFDRCMLKTTSGNLPRFEINVLKIWNYRFISKFKCHEFTCTGCEQHIRFDRCNSFDSAHVLMTAMRQHMGMKLPASHMLLI
eukprot:scaffold121675_cov24-Attheya_sp.AAC.1